MGGGSSSDTSSSLGENTCVENAGVDAHNELDLTRLSRRSDDDDHDASDNAAGKENVFGTASSTGGGGGVSLNTYASSSICGRWGGDSTEFLRLEGRTGWADMAEIIFPVFQLAIHCEL
jgi:hypothetical protein